MIELRSLGDLTAVVDDTGMVRIGIGGADWFGPGTTTAQNPMCGPSTRFVDDMGSGMSVMVADGDVQASVRAYDDRSLVVFRLEAMRAVNDGATGVFDRPSVSWPTFQPAQRNPGSVPGDLRAVVFQHCEFGLPATSDASFDNFFLLPHRPPTGWPIVAQAPGSAAILLAPLNAFHDQTIGLNGGSLRCGWHGDLEEVPAGFVTELGVFGAPNARAAIDAWGALLRTRAGTIRPGRWADALATRPSYWTDNGAAYWYRTEPEMSVGDSIVAAVDDLRSQDVALGAVQLDSWFYPHVDLRPFNTDEWVVPPSAMVAWEPREDVLTEGIVALGDRLGNPPLVAHIRHLSAHAPIAREVPVWVDGDMAVPATAQGYERWLDQCLAWGVETFEHDWLVEVFFGVRELRRVPGRAAAWQAGIDAAARDRGITLQWCMGTPADFAETVHFSQVTSVRTCGDHGYIATPGQLWAWFCTTNALARALGLAPFKDVFRTDEVVAGETGAIEALLSALSTGPVGLGDRVGRCDVDLVAATCRADGVLIKPDVPIAMTSAAMVQNPAFNAYLLVAECFSDHEAGRWAYVVAAHANPADDVVSGAVCFEELGESAPTGEVVVWDFRALRATRMGAVDRVEVTLEREGWQYFVVAPMLAEGFAVIGDVSKFVPAGDARVEVGRLVSRLEGTGESAQRGGVRLVVLGADETVTITGWALCAPSSSVGDVRFDEATNVWELDVLVPSRGWESVVVTPGNA